MFKIGDIEIKSKCVLAPMAGITSAAYRSFMRLFGVSLTYSEMISDCGLILKNPNTLEMLTINKDDAPLAIQLFGNSKETLLKAIDVLDELDLKYDILDINFACPVKKIINSGSGSAYLKDLKRSKETIEAIVLKSKRPVTAKIRLGYDNNSINFLETIRILEEAGVKAIALHARTAKELYTGKCHYDLLTNLQDKMSVPLIISGDIFTLEDAIKASEITHASGIMVARGGLGNPELITAIEKYFTSGEKINYGNDIKLQMNYLVTFMDLLIAEKGEEKAIRYLRGSGPKFIRNFPNYRYYRDLLTKTIKYREDVLKIVHLILEKCNLLD